MKKIIVFLLSLTIAYTPALVWASTAPSGNGWNPKSVTRVGLDDIIEATARKQVVRNGSSVTLEAVVRETVKRQQVGKVLLGRILGGGIGVAGITALIGAVGWVMEDGVYVKYKTDRDPKDPPNSEYYYRSSVATVVYYAKTREELSGIVVSAANALNNGYKYSLISITGTIEEGLFKVEMERNGTKSEGGFTYLRVKNTKYDPDKEDEKQKFVLTPEMVGDLSVGDYTDPVDSKKDKKDRIWTDVENAYKEDPSGIGNELSNALDGKMDAAPETPSKPQTDPPTYGDGQKYPTNQDKGTDGKTDQEVDPETGQPTGQGSFTLPAWCLWAADNCEWHKEDKAHQTQEKTVWEDEKKHRADEKTFWQTIKDWLDWTKEEPEQDTDTQVEVQQPEEFDTSIFTKDRFQVSRQCPVPEQHTITLTGVSVSFTFDLTPLCTVLEMARPALVACSYLYAAYIVIGAARNG
ncbi:hypothetical protein F4U02_01130 [Acinetobacter haemolyticus]|uniref:virulence factor TspB C-terminal domain-related protein n=1 Tax=Acinetobacter haemolyticus TaxID=29430 RepID=UPI0012988096|nr:virulence factor TspB C-terminal domain-related protein [Acinetobacter haemolyticus]MQZ29608.1 hypothetical protein [Acinetobacter haemolyticus]MQZ29617.1 hypothetical protein [Acinetobacter haemolyticus]